MIITSQIDGYRMIESAHIDNFRGFRSADMKNCRTINVVVGKNGSGKTSLLEAIYLAIGSPQTIPRYAENRGLIRPSPGIDGDRYLWSTVFFDSDLTLQPLILLKGTGRHERSVKISYDIMAAQFEVIQNGQQQIMVSPVRFEYSQPSGNTIVRMAPTQTGYSPVGAAVTTLSVYYAPTMFVTQEQLAQRFSVLSNKNMHHEVVREMQNEFDFIQGIEVSAPIGVPSIYAQITGLKSKLPLGFVSGGVSKIMSYLVSIASIPGGVLVIDEIDNGIYFDRFAALWRSLYGFAKANSVQIFASTHSNECLQALADVSSEWLGDVSFIRAERNGAESTIREFSGQDLVDGLEFGEEVR